LPYDFDGIEAEDVTLDIIQPPKVDRKKNRPKDVEIQKQDEKEEEDEEPGCKCNFGISCCLCWTVKIIFLCGLTALLLFFVSNLILFGELYRA
jgi:hypothetical protein